MYVVIDIQPESSSRRTGRIITVPYALRIVSRCRRSLDHVRRHIRLPGSSISNAHGTALGSIDFRPQKGPQCVLAHCATEANTSPRVSIPRRRVSFSQFRTLLPFSPPRFSFPLALPAPSRRSFTHHGHEIVSRPTVKVDQWDRVARVGSPGHVSFD